jgi:uncharacterized damage-inducible protein DinB
MEIFRNNGIIGAMLDEYEKALNELDESIANLSNENLLKTIDFETTNPDCKSIQTILTHIIRSGYCYALEIRKSLGENLDFPIRKLFNTVPEYQMELKRMFEFNEKLFEDYPNLKIEETEDQLKILTNWNQKYDVEQLFEHAIVHILKHRRQINRFKQRLN